MRFELLFDPPGVEVATTLEAARALGRRVAQKAPPSRRLRSWRRRRDGRNGARRDAEDTAHCTRHMALVRKTRRQRHLARRQVAPQEQGSGTFDPAPNDVLVDGKARRSLEERLEVGVAEGGLSGELRNRKRLVQALFDERDQVAKTRRRESAPSCA